MKFDIELVSKCFALEKKFAAAPDFWMELKVSNVFYFDKISTLQFEL